MGFEPFDNCPAMDGYHCHTNSLAKIYYHYGCPLTEEMLLGIGSGIGFMYWHPKGAMPLVGGRGNVKNFFTAVGMRTGVRVEVKTTTSERKARSSLIESLEQKKPVMLFGDIGLMPYFDLPEWYHFGSHTFVACGYDGKGSVLVSDIEQGAGGLKKGLYHNVSLDMLSLARNSPYKPFPPKNSWLEFDFNGCRTPGMIDFYSSITQTASEMLDAPRSNLGVKGIRRAAEEIRRWTELFEGKALRMNLFNLYLFIEANGTGGGCFRYMYARYLEEVYGVIAENSLKKALLRAASRIRESGRMFTELGLLFRKAGKPADIPERIERGSELFEKIASIEEETFESLAGLIPRTGKDV